MGKKYSMADVFQRVGEKTPITMRFSTVGGEEGSADVARDWVWNNTPVFFIRDPAKFPNFIHTQKRNPQTHLKDKDVMRLFSDLGTPYGFRHMNGWSGHTYRLDYKLLKIRTVKEDDSWHYVKSASLQKRCFQQALTKILCRFSAYTDQGIKNHTNAEATALAGSNPDFGTQDLFEAIEAGNYPSWTVYVQAITPEAAKTFRCASTFTSDAQKMDAHHSPGNVLDLTKDWSEQDVPREEIGKLVLTQNPKNYFAEIEQVAFAPGHMVAGVEPSEDPVLQSRLFAYPDAQRYRLGVNYQTIPVNCPFAPVANFQRDGRAVHDDNQGSRPNYPSTQEKLNLPKRPYNDANHTIWTGGAVRYLSEVTDVDFEWPKYFWGNLTNQDQDNFIGNVVGHLGLATSETIKKRQLALFAKVNKSLGQRLAQGMNITM
ncbi:hypothetical protein HWV62_26534 [Athelia sp. TMB]|nr:hypothetical protein HWV62_26534 [Athelia sp. TMB]